jgi:D-3-phosphoglycerate dehydrogenase
MPASERPTVVAASAALLSSEIQAELEATSNLVLDPAGPAALAAADAAIASWHLQLGPAELEAAPRLRAITHLGTGVHVDLAAATRLNIPVFNNPGYNAPAVAEHTIALMLAAVKRVAHSDRLVRTGAHWEVLAPELYTSELAGKTLGIVGFGQVGRRVAAMARAGFGMHVLGFDSSSGLVASLGFEEVSLDDLLRRSDVLSVHAALTPDSHHLLGRSELALLKPAAYVVNTARAEVIDYEALADQLRAGRLAGAALDTWPDHHGDPQSYLLDGPRLVLTQQNAGLTHEAAERTRVGALEGLRAALAGERPAQSRLLNESVWETRRRPA